MRILLTDDEHMIRLGLINMLDELYPSQHTYREACNGEEMLSISADFRPDIAFVDIRMPGMSGLDAVEECQKICPNTQYLILSGYSDFEYARAGLRLGTTEYLLKPVSPETLRQAIATASARLKNNMLRINDRFSNLVSDSYHTGQPLVIPELADSLGFALITVDCASSAEASDELAKLSASLRQCLNDRFSTNFRFSLFFGSGNVLCLVSAGEYSGLSVLIKEAAENCDSCITYHEIRGINEADFHTWRRRLHNAIGARITCGCGRGVSVTQSFLERCEQLLPFSEQLVRLSGAFVAQNEIEYKNILNEIYRNESFAKLYPLADGESIRRYFLAVFGLEVETSGFKELVRSLIDCANHIHMRHKRETQDDIEWVKKYIQTNYMSDVTIASIADLMGISPNYLSRIFHERVGCKFISYLTDVRIANAKRLFHQQPKPAVHEVAEMVGYFSARHFTKTFLRVTGYLPSEYPERAGAKAEDPQTHAESEKDIY